MTKSLPLLPIMEDKEVDNTSISTAEDVTIPYRERFAMSSLLQASQKQTLGQEYHAKEEGRSRSCVNAGDDLNAYFLPLVFVVLWLNRSTVQNNISVLICHKTLFYFTLMLCCLPFIWFSAHSVVHLRDATEKCSSGGNQGQEKHRNEAISFSFIIFVAYFLDTYDVCVNDLVKYTIDRKIVFFSVMMLGSLPFILYLPHMVIFLLPDEDYIGIDREEGMMYSLPPPRSTNAAQNNKHRSHRTSKKKYKSAKAKEDQRVSPVSVCDMGCIDS